MYIYTHTHYKNYMCAACVCLCNRRLWKPSAWPWVKHWLISQFSSLQGTRKVVLKVHATGLATSKNTGLIGLW